MALPNALILPNAGRIRHLFHISDLHIRTGDRNKSRYQEYQTVLQRFVDTLANWPVEQRDAAVTVITGDLFHHKLKVESAGLDLLLDFLNQLTRWTPVYILRGNHDYRQESPDEMDMLSPLLLKTGLQRICYLDQTGHYLAGDVGFGLVTVQDALMAGAASGRMEALPPFPDPAAFDAAFAKIALFHGTVEPAAPAIAAKQCVPLAWFGEGYDAILLGDIHLQQVRRVFKHDVGLSSSSVNNVNRHMPYATCIETGLTWRIRDPATAATVARSQPWGYAGSLVQQHFGEPLIGHGFLHWNLEACTVDRYHITNDYGWMTLKEAVADADATAADRALLDHPAFPKSNLHIRMREGSMDANAVLRELQDRQCKSGLCLHTYTLLRTQGGRQGVLGDVAIEATDATEATEASSMDGFDMSTCTIHDPASWCRFIEEKGGAVAGGELGGDAWKAFFQKEQWKKSLLPEDDLVRSILPDHVLGKIRDRNSKIEKLYANYESSPETAAGGAATTTEPTGSYKLLGVEWSYLLCYGEGCRFRFDAVPSDSIIAMNGRNGHGKTSFLEILCLALFGEGFPSRATKQGSIVHHGKPASASAWSRIEIAIPNESKGLQSQDLYILQRDFTTASKPKQAILMRGGSYSGAAEGEEAEKEILHRGKTAVDGWVRQTLGTLDGFLMGGMMTQHEDRDFFSLKPVDQRDLLDRALGMHASTRFVDWLKESRLAHAYVLDLVQALLQDVKKSQMLSEDEAGRIQQECEEIRAALDALRTEETQQDAHLQECMQRLDADPEWLQKGRNTLEAMLASLPMTEAGVEEEASTEQSLMNTLATLRAQWCGFDVKELELSSEDAPIPTPTRTKAEAMADWKRYGAWARKQTSRLQHTDPDKSETEAAEELAACEKRLEDLLEEQRRLQDTDHIPEKSNITLKDCNATCDALVEIYGSIEVLIQNVRILEMHQAARVETLPMTEDAYRQATEQMQKLGRATETESESEPVGANPGMVHRCMALLRDVQPWVIQRSAQTGPAQKAAATKKIMDRLTDFFTGLEESDQNSIRQAEPDWKDVLDCVRTGTWRASYDQMTECLADLQRTREDLQRHQADLQTWTSTMTLSAKARTFEEWQQNVKRVRTDVEKAQVLLKQLQEHAAWMKERTQMESLGREAQEALDAIAQWERQEARRAWNQYQAVDAQLKNLRIRQHASKALACIDVWEEIREIRARLEQCRKEVTDVQKKLGILTERWERHIAVSTKHAQLDALVKQLHTNMVQLAHVTQWMESGYKAWAYQHQIMPMLGHRVNAVMRAFQARTPESERLVFHPDAVDTTGPMTLRWDLCMGNGHKVPLEKASGFQRFLVRLAMRMVLGHLHVGDMVRRPCQLFLDEGFTACDALHLANVPTFLRCLLSMYDQIVLVSHLEEVREQTDVQVRIQMDPHGFSCIQCR